MSNVTGRIENWTLYEQERVIIGNLYDDIHDRWGEGQVITTSRLLPMSMQANAIKEGSVVSTQNSHYLLGKKK